MLHNYAWRLVILIGMMLVLTACITQADSEIKPWPKSQRAQAHVDLGNSYLQRGNLAIARSRFERALQVDSDSSGAYHGLGLIAATSLEFDLARKYLARAVSLDNNNIKATSDYAVVLCDSGLASKGIPLLSKVKLDLKTNNLGVQLAMGHCYRADNRYIEAESAYRSVLEIDSNLRQALLSMAHLKFRDENLITARGFLQRYFSTNTISSDALLLGAKIENGLADMVQRDQYTRQLWARYPKSEHAVLARELFSQ